MKKYFADGKNGYEESIREGLSGVRRFREGFSAGLSSRAEGLRKLRTELDAAEAILIGAGAGLSTSAGLTYSGERFHRYFHDFERAFGIRDIYSGGFFPFPDEETRWAWWSRHIYFNRYIDPPTPVYQQLLSLVKGKEYFVLTTNVDHQFQRAGFDKRRLFYTQGDYGLFQSVDPRNQKTYDNEDWVMRAMEAMGFVREENGAFRVPEEGKIAMRLPTALLPKCPEDGSAVAMNLRSDDTFVEDAGWHAASARYAAFLERHRTGRILYLELGVGANTPLIIKYPFWAMTNQNPSAVYACLNKEALPVPEEISDRSVVISGDSAQVIGELVS